MRPAGAAVLLGFVLSALIACDAVEDPDPPSPDAAAGVGTAEDLEAPALPQDPTPGGDGSQIELLALKEWQLDSMELPGELACAFADAERGTLLVARADVLPDGAVYGLLNNNGYTEMLANTDAGGFNDLLDGITLTGKGMTVLIERQAPEPTGDESTQHAANLLVQQADGAARTYAGTLTCGP